VKGAEVVILGLFNELPLLSIQSFRNDCALLAREGTPYSHTCASLSFPEYFYRQFNKTVTWREKSIIFVLQKYIYVFLSAAFTDAFVDSPS
jgi:hypothetical protein